MFAVAFPGDRESKFSDSGSILLAACWQPVREGRQIANIPGCGLNHGNQFRDSGLESHHC